MKNLPNKEKPNLGTKKTELPEDADYRGIAGKASLNHEEERKEESAKGESTNKSDDNKNPLIQGI